MAFNFFYFLLLRLSWKEWPGISSIFFRSWDHSEITWRSRWNNGHKNLRCNFVINVARFSCLQRQQKHFYEENRLAIYFTQQMFLLRCRHEKNVAAKIAGHIALEIAACKRAFKAMLHGTTRNINIPRNILCGKLLHGTALSTTKTNDRYRNILRELAKDFLCFPGNVARKVDGTMLHETTCWLFITAVARFWTQVKIKTRNMWPNEMLRGKLCCYTVNNFPPIHVTGKMMLRVVPCNIASKGRLRC